MRKYLISLLLSETIILNVFGQKSEFWMFGPMIHFNFGNNECHASYGLELAYWKYDHFPYSLDGGIEFEKKKIRVYSEGQTGLGLVGVSLGPAIEFRTAEKAVKVGIQGSCWANYFGGVDLRFRSIAGTSFFSPGVYFKLPLGGSSGEHHSSSHHWHD